MAKNTKNWISWERNITFLWNKKILNQCLRWYILRTYHFVEKVSFNSRRTILASSLDYLCWGGIINNFTLFIYIYISIYTYYFYIYIYIIYIYYTLYIYKFAKKMLQSDCPILGAEIVSARKRFQHPLLIISKPATITQSTIYELGDRKNWILKHGWFLMSY